MSTFHDWRFESSALKVAGDRERLVYAGRAVLKGRAEVSGDMVRVSIPSEDYAKLKEAVVWATNGWVINDRT